MKNFKNLSYCFILCFALQGCSVFDWLVYQPDIKQGNQIEQRQLDLLRIAMTKEQVVYILGTPLTPDMFDTDHWYYLSYFKSGINAQTEQKSIALTFRDGRLVDIKSDYPLSKNFYTPLSQAETRSAQAPQEAKKTATSPTTVSL